MAALRELLLAAERDRQPLDDAILSFSRSLLLSPPKDSNDAAKCTAESAASLCLQFLTVHTQGELLLRVWPDQHGAGSRWEKRESFATFLHVVTHLLQTQQQQDAAQAEAFALRVVREKTSQLEKLLSWSDKPLIEFRALELLATVAKVSGSSARELVRLFNFQCPAFVKLATRRWKKPEVDEEEVKQAPFQLRAAYVDLVLALTACPDKSVHRFAVKEGGVTASLLKSMDGDSTEMLTTIFNRLGELVLHNPEVEHKSKLIVFNATCVHQLLSLLQVEDDESVRDTALGVLNALFFENSALYVVPQKQALRLFLAKSASNPHGDEEATTSEQAYALKVIRNAVGTVGVNEHLRSTQAQTLVMQFLAKYPGFLSEYLAALSVQLEPKPVYRWFCVASLVQKLLSCSLDAVATGLPTVENEGALSSWCSAQSVASRLIAPGNYRKELSRCIQHTNNLVIYSSLGVIEATLKRYVRLASTLESLGLAAEVQSELRFLLPSPEALVSLLLKLCASQERKMALIYVRALTVFRLYLECLPQTMREVKVDFTKTLMWRYLDGKEAEDSLPQPMQSLIVGEMLRFLLAVDTPRLRFLFTSGNSGKHSKLQQMLLLYVSTPSQAVQELAGKVLQRTLLASDIFGHETLHADGRANEEVQFWLESLRQSGSEACAEFTERLARAAMADPLMYVAVGRRVMADASCSSSLSPITVALVGFLNLPDGAGKPNLSAYRADPSVVTYAVRIVLALKQTSKYPQQLVDLIASKDAFTVDISTSKHEEENDETSSDDSSGKKRKRSEGADESGRDDAYVWLKNHCEALVSGKRTSSNTATPKKKARASSIKWHRYCDPSSLTAALVAMTPADFTSFWEHIVSNCADLDELFGPVLHYLSAHADVDILSLLTSPATAKPKKQPAKTAAADAFTKIVPASTILQHVLFNIAGKETKEQDSMISTVSSMAKRRVTDHQLAATEAARMCEQLLFFFFSSQAGVLETVNNQLCELFLQLLTVVLVNEAASPSIVTRIFFKLQAVTTSTPNAALWRQLSAVEIFALRVYSSKNPDTDLGTLCDIGGLFQRAGVPLVAVLAPSIPISVRLPVLDRLLHQYSASSSAPHVVLVSRVLESLGGHDMDKQYDSFAEYKRAKLLTRKLWQLLSSQNSERQLSFFTTGFMVLRHLGGIDASIAVGSVEDFLASLVSRSAQSASSCTEVLRGIIGAIQSDKEAAVFPGVLEEHLLKRLRREKNVQVKCELVAAMYNVFTRVGSSRQFVDALIPVCYERVLLGSLKSYSAELAVLKHVSIDASSEEVDKMDASLSAVVTKLARSERDEALTSVQLLGLLMLLRSNSNIASMDVSLLLVLVRSGLSALKTASDKANWFHEFEATVLLVENAVGSLKRRDQDAQLSALKMVLPLLAEAREVVRESANQLAFQGLVDFTAAFLRLVGNDASAVDFDFDAHFEVVVQHPCFAPTLQNVDDDAVRLRVIRVVARLACITHQYTRSLLQTLLSCYSMSLSSFDRCLRVLFEEFETQGSREEELTLVSMGFRFGESSTVAPSTEASKRSHNDLVDDSAWVLGGGLEQNRIRSTIEHFPLDRQVSTASDALLLELDEDIPAERGDDLEQSLETDEKRAEAYDPAFLLPMLSHVISSSDLPDGGIVQQGLLGVAIRATSSDVEKIREYAYGILAHLHESLQATTETTSEFKAGRQVHLLLDVFRRGVQEPLEQVPSVVTVFLNDALAVLTRPTHVLYPQVNHFLLARPAMDLADVPMFYSLFNSRAPLTYRQERSWLLHTLRRGVRSDDDVALLERRHVLPMLLSFFTSELADTHTQPLITSILLSALRTPSGSVYLVTKAALLEWLATQFLRYGTSSKPSGSMKAASTALLLPLMTLLEQALQDEVWDTLDAIQQHAAALQAANAFTAMQAAVVTRRVGSRNEYLVTNKAAVVAALVVRRAGSVASLELLHTAIEVVQLFIQGGSALDSAEMVASSLNRWLLQQRHYEAQKHRFADWAILIRRVASILVSWNSTTVMNQQRERRALEQLKTVLDHLPTLKHLVLAPSTDNQQSVYAPALL
ncbi:Nucleolar pre-ribosomal-associated protein 1 [Phytophthora infestans]|uniref:Nucleolar pre-ribosomal-associated protein 1 n=1 Tax=Phytophthora infestans TaxID=4787 RepID=A0A8S9TSZ5_PHYIN|nr:Nucleolar pre-ribosomal-associated protein 1 [Phytophthora infestans]